MNIALLYGGKSGEHEVSLVSAAAVARNFNTEHKVHLIGVTKDGKWFLQDESELERVRSDEKAKLSITEKNPVLIMPAAGSAAFVVDGKSLEVDVVFPLIHGTYGEDGTLQGLLEMCDVPFVGCGVVSSSVTFDKEKTKACWRDAGLPVVPGILMTRADTSDSKRYDSIMEKAEKEIGYPLFVKPCSAGSSNGCEKAPSLRHLHYALGQAFLWDDKVLIEKAINAREIECAVTGNSITDGGSDPAEKVTAHFLGEIAPKTAFYDYDTKYNNPDAAELWIPAHLDDETTKKIKEMAVAAYKTVDAAGLSRVDFFMDKDTGEIYLNEINTIPGFTQISMFPKLCAADGIEFSDLTEMLIREAILQFEAKKRLVTSR